MKISVFMMMVILMITGCSASSPEKTGLIEGRLMACPDSPNCVLSQMEDKTGEHTIKPFEYSGTPEKALETLESIVAGMKRTRIVKKEAHYIHAEFKSAVFRFVDDVEFLADEKTGVIHVRSASRTGKSDFGVNRKRVEMIRELFLKTPQGKTKS